MGTNDIRDRLSDSSRAFLKRATEELEKSPRHAVVDLCAGIELLMKARLAHEHWSLVADKPGEVPLDQMEKGAFDSVGFRKAIARVEVVTRSNFSKADKNLLMRLGYHRNMVAHFYNPELDTDDPELLASAAAEQCRAWLLVERLVTKDWEDVFKAERHLWLGLKARFSSNTTFLREKFVTIEPELMALMNKNVAIEDCQGCGFLASKLTHHPHCTVTLNCLLCSSFNHIARVSCPSCGTVYSGQMEITPYCKRCDRYLWDCMGLAAKPTALCCLGSIPTVHRALEGTGGLCSLCLDTGTISRCPYCHTFWMLTFSDDLLEGCANCHRAKMAPG